MTRGKRQKTRAWVACLMYILIIVQTVMAAFAGVLSASALSAYAAESYPYDDTAIADDLSGLGAEIPDISVPGEDVQVIALAEFAFAEDPADCENYSLYLYVYDPAGHSYSTVTDENAVNMAVSYDEYGEANGYMNLPLVYCSNTDDKTVWKFRVVDKDGQVLSNAQAQDAAEGKRRYDVVGVQLREVGTAMAEDHKVGRTFYYEGYSEGMSGESALGSTLTVNNEKVVRLEVEHAFYRPDQENEGGSDTYDSLASVYFAIPNEYIEEYGELYAVRAEYLKVITDYIFVTGEQAVYDELSAHVGEDLSGLDLQYGFGAGRHYIVDEQHIGYDLTYNMRKEKNGVYYHQSDKALDKLYYIFQAEQDKASDRIISTDELTKYMLNYSTGKSDLILGRYARELFSAVDEEKTPVRLSASETLPITQVNLNDWWEMFFGDYYTEVQYNVPAIQTVEKVESAEQVCADYYIDETCYNDFKAYYDEHTTESTVYVFHFAVDDYYSAEAVNLDNQSDWYYEMEQLSRSGKNAYVAQEAVYLDFDIIDISMNDGGKITVLGVVSDPIDIIPPITPPPSEDVWWIVAAIIAAVLIIILVIVQIVRNQSGGETK